MNCKQRLKSAGIAGRKSGLGRAPLQRPKPLELRVMSARNEFHYGQAVWKYSLRGWICVYASESLKFLEKCTEKAGKFELMKRGYLWEWH